ncbi:MAG: lipoprotein insertase outer membrane protein LolB [Gammaproteobacteria bacterium]
MRINVRFIIALVASLFILVGCASLSPPPQPQNQTQTTEKRVVNLSSIKNWELKGLIAVRANKSAWSANWQWQQTQKNYTISLIGPLGSNSLKLTGAPNQVLLETSDGKKLTSTSPESLLEQQLGWQLPVSNLYYWIRGLPVPNTPAQKHYDAFNHLTDLSQDGWTIQYLRYTSINHIDVPNKIYLANTKMNVKIVINQWQF